MERAEDTARWLVDDALDLVGTCTEDLSGTSELSVAAGLRQRGLTVERANLVVDVAAARLRARVRWPDADALLFTREALEQASDPLVSAWRAERLVAASHGPTWDLCAGVGGDALALARHTPVDAVDRDPVRIVLLEHNARVLSRPVRARLSDALQVPLRPGDRVHVDPGRRDGSRRLRRLTELRPPVDALVSRFDTGATTSGSLVVALPPAVDLDDPVLVQQGPIARVEFVQVGADLVEGALWKGAVVEAPGVQATLLSDGGVPQVRTRTGPPEHLPVGPVGEILVEVAPSAVRARIHPRIGAEIGARRLDERRALLTCDDVPPASPWYRCRRVEGVLSVRGRRVREWLRSRDDLPVEIVLHGVSGSDATWWERFGRPRRGPGGRRAEVIRTSHGAEVLMTVPVGSTGWKP